MGRFDNRVFMELGTNVGSVEIVKYAKSEGAHIIVADYLEPEYSEAKRYADESFLISTVDTDALIALARDRNVDSVFCGVSEMNILSAKAIADRLGLPSYFTMEQWNTFMNKGSFRRACEQFGVDTPKTYFVGRENTITEDVIQAIQYPVIVKPVDNGANIGISICKSREKLDEAIRFAFNSSSSRTIIIEQFVEGSEFSPTYVIQDHKCKLVCLGTKYAYKNEKDLQALAHGYVYPSPYVDEYLEKADYCVKKMILENGLNNCTIFFQGIYSDHEFYFFEAGLRMEGTASYRITEAMNGQNFMRFMVDCAMGNKTEYDIDKEDATFGNRKCFIFSLISRGGVITRIEGTDRVHEDKNIFAFEQRHYIGKRIENDGTLKQIAFRFAIKNSDIDEVIKTIEWIKKTVRMYDDKGEDMLIQDFDPGILRD